MTGPELYSDALRHLEIAARHHDRDEVTGMQFELAVAQVKATLALAEAYVASAVMRPEDRDDWDRATGRLEREEPEESPLARRDAYIGTCSGQDVTRRKP